MAAPSQDLLFKHHLNDDVLHRILIRMNMMCHIHFAKYPTIADDSSPGAVTAAKNGAKKCSELDKILHCSERT